MSIQFEKLLLLRLCQHCDPAVYWP